MSEKKIETYDSKQLFLGMRDSFGDMLSLLTHDVNNKLSRLMILQDQLADPKTAKEAEEKFSATVQGIAQMMRTATSMYLDRDSVLELTNTGVVIDGAVQVVKKRLDQKNISLSVIGETQDIECKLHQIQFALARLFSYFAKFLPAGSKISIAATKSQERLKIEVRANQPVEEAGRDSVEIFMVEQIILENGGNFSWNRQPILTASVEL